MSEEMSTGQVVVAMALILVISVFVASFTCYDAGTKAVRAEAVERGYAEWVADKFGNVEFRWKGEEE